MNEFPPKNIGADDERQRDLAREVITKERILEHVELFLKSPGDCNIYNEVINLLATDTMSASAQGWPNQDFTTACLRVIEIHSSNVAHSGLLHNQSCIYLGSLRTQ